MECNIFNCEVCGERLLGGQLETYCKECTSPYLPTVNGMSCNLCQDIANCQYCDNFLYMACGQCMSGHIITADGQCNCQYKGSHCVLCNEDHLTCRKCEDGYLPTEDGSQCGKCPDQYPDCKYCRNGAQCDSQCALCKNGMRPQGYAKCGTCQHVQDCLYCDMSDLMRCARCAQRYILLERGAKQICLYTGIDNCTEFSDDKCTRCMDGYTLGYAGLSCGTCAQTDKNCFLCDEVRTSACVTCKVGYALNIRGECVDFQGLLDPNCAYVSGMQCAKCKGIYVLVEDRTCGTCGGLCNKCIGGAGAHLCQQCNQTVSTVVSSDQATGEICCPLNCLQCTPVYSQKCTEFDDNDQCAQYTTYFSTAVCTKCDTFTVLTTFGFCSSMCADVEFCQLCDHLAQRCTKCLDGMVLSNGRCYACDHGLVPNIDGTACVHQHCSGVPHCNYCAVKWGRCAYCVDGIVTQDGLHCGTCSQDCGSCDNLDRHLCHDCKNPALFPTYLGGCVTRQQLLVQAEQLREFYPYKNQSIAALGGGINFKALHCQMWYTDERCIVCDDGWQRTSEQRCEKISLQAKILGFFSNDHIIYLMFGAALIYAFALHIVVALRRRKPRVSRSRKID